MTQLDSSPQAQFYRGGNRAAVFAGQKNEEQVRAQCQALIAAPGIAGESRAFAWNAIAKSFKREHDVKPPNALKIPKNLLAFFLHPSSP